MVQWSNKQVIYIIHRDREHSLMMRAFIVIIIAGALNACAPTERSNMSRESSYAFYLRDGIPYDERIEWRKMREAMFYGKDIQ